MQRNPSYNQFAVRRWNARWVGQVPEGARCSCGSTEDLVKPGPKLPVACRPCFLRWDAQQEVDEHFAASWEVYLERPAPTPRRSVRPTRLDQQIASARRRLAARGIQVEAA